MSDLWRAALRGDLEEVLRQITAHDDIKWAANLWGATPLLIAAQNGHDAIVDALLQHGACVDQAATDNGATTLFIAAQNGHSAIVKALLRHGASVNRGRTDTESTPLYIAAQNGHGAVAETLLRHGASVDLARTDTGATPLMIASYTARIDAVALLLSNGASLHHRASDDGSTCFTFARDPQLNPNPYHKHGLLYRLRMWPISMAILVLQELSLYYKIDCSSLMDLYEYIGTEVFTVDKEEDYFELIKKK